MSIESTPVTAIGRHDNSRRHDLVDAQDRHAIEHAIVVIRGALARAERAVDTGRYMSVAAELHDVREYAVNAARLALQTHETQQAALPLRDTADACESADAPEVA